MPFVVLSLDELHELLLAGHQNLLPDHNVSRFSDNWKRTRVPALAVTDAHAHIDQVARDVLPDTAEGDILARHGAIRNVSRRAATTARGTAAGRVKGTLGSSWTASDTLSHKSGAQYKPVGPGSIPSGLQTDIDLISVTTGVDANLDAGEFLTWDTTPTGLEDEVELVVALQSAEDQEEEGAYQARILERIGDPAKGGTAGDYVVWVRAATDAAGDAMSIDEGYVWKHRNGFGSTDVAGLFDGTGSNRLMTAAQRTALQTFLDALAPVTHQPRVLQVLAEPISVESLVTPTSDTQYQQDWDDDTPLVVSAWTASTRLLKFTANRPASMDVGDRVIVAGHTGAELVIERFGTNPDEVIIKETLYTPVAAENVYSGGPLVAPIRASIQALFDSLGPRFGDFGAGSFKSTLYTADLFESVQLTTGVLDSTLTAPAANVLPSEKAYPNDAQINVLTANEILVRYA